MALRPSHDIALWALAVLLTIGTLIGVGASVVLPPGVAVLVPLTLGPAFLAGYVSRQSAFEESPTRRWLLRLRRREPERAATPNLPGGSRRGWLVAACGVTAGAAVVAAVAGSHAGFVVAFLPGVVLARCYGYVHRGVVLTSGRLPRLRVLRLGPRPPRRIVLPQGKSRSVRYERPGGVMLATISFFLAAVLLPMRIAGREELPLLQVLPFTSWLVLPGVFIWGQAYRQLESDRLATATMPELRFLYALSRPWRTTWMTSRYAWRVAGALSLVTLPVAGVAAFQDWLWTYAAITATGCALAAIAGYAQQAYVTRSGTWEPLAVRMRGDLPDPLRTMIDDDVDEFGDRLTALRERIGTAKIPVSARQDYVAAVRQHRLAYEEADRAGAADETRPIRAALEEGGWRLARAEARLAGGRPPERRTPCFFDPRHGPSTSDVSWRDPNGVLHLVPSCPDDIARVVAGEEPRLRLIPVDGLWRPHWWPHQDLEAWTAGYYPGAAENATWLRELRSERRMAEITSGRTSWFAT